MDRTGLAPRGDDAGVRWVAVRHADDHVHIVATLARLDGSRPRTWNDFYRVREACQAAEERYGLRLTAPADRTAAKRPTRAETEQAARRGWDEPPRIALRRHVCTAAAGARTEHEFFAALEHAGVLVRRRHSTIRPGEVTGYAVGLPQHTARTGGVVWYGGGKLAADLTLPKLRRRWAGTGADRGPVRGLSAPAARAVLRNAVTDSGGAGAAASRSSSRGCAMAGSGCGCGSASSTRARSPAIRSACPAARATRASRCGTAAGGFPESSPCPGCAAAGQRTVPQARNAPEQDLLAAERSGSPLAERDAIFEDAARQAALAAEHIRRCAEHDPAGGADAAWAAADTLHAAARATGSRVLRRAAGSYDRAARAPYGRIPGGTPGGDGLRTAARVLALTGTMTGDMPLAAVTLIANLVALAVAVAELRQAQQHAAQAAAARAAAEHLHTAVAAARARGSARRPGPGAPPRPAGHGRRSGPPRCS